MPFSEFTSSARRFAGALALAMLAGVCSAPAVEIIAHRGASHDAPENTLASFRLGWDQDCDANELDMWLTKDNQIVVMHDSTTKRTTGVVTNIADLTLAELRQMDAGRWKGTRWTGEKIPTLAEVIATIPDGKRMFIEIKCGPEIFDELQRVLRASGKKTEQLAIISFNYEVVKQAKKRFPRYQIYWLTGWKIERSTGKRPEVEWLIGKARLARLDGLDICAEPEMDAEFVSKIHAAGLKLYVWTVDDADLARKLAALGVDGITTNRPQWLREQLKLQ